MHPVGGRVHPVSGGGLMEEGGERETPVWRSNGGHGGQIRDVAGGPTKERKSRLILLFPNTEKSGRSRSNSVTSHLPDLPSFPSHPWTLPTPDRPYVWVDRRMDSSIGGASDDRRFNRSVVRSMLLCYPLFLVLDWFDFCHVSTLPLIGSYKAKFQVLHSSAT